MIKLIAGAGIAGPTLAFWLSRAGFRPTLIEHAPALRAGGYVVDFWGLGYGIAERHIAPAGQLAEHARAETRHALAPLADNANLAHMIAEAIKVGGQTHALGRSDLSRLIFDKVQTTSEAIFGDQIVLLDERADGVQVQFERSAARKFDLVVGADGAALDRAQARIRPAGSLREESRLQGRRIRDARLSSARRGGLCASLRTRPHAGALCATRRPDALSVRLRGRFAAFPATLDVAAQKTILCRECAEASWETPRILDALKAPRTSTSTA